MRHCEPGAMAGRMESRSAPPLFGIQQWCQRVVFDAWQIERKTDESAAFQAIGTGQQAPVP